MASKPVSKTSVPERAVSALSVCSGRSCAEAVVAGSARARRATAARRASGTRGEYTTRAGVASARAPRRGLDHRAHGVGVHGARPVEALAVVAAELAQQLG